MTLRSRRCASSCSRSCSLSCSTLIKLPVCWLNKQAQPVRHTDCTHALLLSLLPFPLFLWVYVMPFVCYCLCENFFDMATETDGRLYVCVCECMRVCGCACHMARSRKIIFTCQPKIVRKPLPLPRHPPFTDYATCSATGSDCSVVMRAKRASTGRARARSEMKNGQKWLKISM